MPDLSLDLRYLRCVLLAAEHGSFRRAAAALDLPQSTVSRRILLLEHRIGFPLFVRDRRGVTLTVAGADFLKQAVVAARQLDRAARFALEIHRGHRGELNVGILASLAGGFLHELLRRFREIHRNVRVALSEGSPQEILHAVAMGELDVSFVSGRPQIPGHESRVLWHESVYAVLPATHELADRKLLEWDDLRGEAFIVSRGGPGAEIQDYLIRRLSRPGFRPRIGVHDVSRGSLLNLVAISYGITLTSTSTLGKDIDGLAFRPIAGERGVLPLSAVWQGTNNNPALRHVLELAEKLSQDYSLEAARLFTGSRDGKTE